MAIKDILVKAVKAIPNLFEDYKSEILLGGGIVLGISATISAVKCTPKALKAIKEYENKLLESEEDSEVIFQKHYHSKNGQPVLNFKDKVKACWKCYIPTAVLTTMSVGSSVASGIASGHKLAAVTTAAQLTETAFTTYKNEVIKKIGPDENLEIEKSAAVAAAPKLQPGQPVIFSNERTEENSIPYIDGLAGDRFWSNPTKIEHAANEIQRCLMDDVYLSWNEARDFLELPRIGMGDELYFNVDQGRFEFSVGDSAEMVGDYPYAVVGYPYIPKKSRQGR